MAYSLLDDVLAFSLTCCPSCCDLGWYIYVPSGHAGPGLQGNEYM